MPLFYVTLPRDERAALRLLNMTKNFCVSAVNRLIRPFFVFSVCRLLSSAPRLSGVSIYLGFPKVAGKLASVARLKRIVA